MRKREKSLIILIVFIIFFLIFIFDSENSPEKQVAVFFSVNIIDAYQNHISPKIWCNKKICHYSPTCSEYMKKAMMKYGFFKGGLKGAFRIVSCNPWSKGGVDEP